MSTTEAREYLKTAVQTETGCDILKNLGLAAIIKAPAKGDDASTVRVAEMVQAEMRRRYKL